MDDILPKEEPNDEQHQSQQQEAHNFDTSEMESTETDAKNVPGGSLRDEEPMLEQLPQQQQQEQQQQQQQQPPLQQEQSEAPEQPSRFEYSQTSQQNQEQSQQQQAPTHSEAPQQLFGFSTNSRTSAPTLTKSNLLEAIVDFDSSLPDAVVHHFLNVAGMQTSDQRIIRLIAIAAQKFIHDIISDSLQHCKLRGKKTKDKKYTLAIEDLASALAEYGIEVRRQHYFN